MANNNDNNMSVRTPKIPTYWHGAIDKNGKPDPSKTGFFTGYGTIRYLKE